MIAPLEKLIDWSSVQVMTLMMPAKEVPPDFRPTNATLRVTGGHHPESR